MVRKSSVFNLVLERSHMHANTSSIGITFVRLFRCLISHDVRGTVRPRAAAEPNFSNEVYRLNIYCITIGFFKITLNAFKLRERKLLLL